MKRDQLLHYHLPLLLAIQMSFLFIVQPTFAQSADEDGHAVPPSAMHLAEARLSAQQSAMMVLGSWAGVSLLAGSVLAFRSAPTSRLRYSAYQHIGWGAINALIAGAALYGIRQDYASLDTLGIGTQAILEELGREHQFGKLLLVNVGLDVGYIAIGGTLMWLSREASRRQSMLFGSGLGVLIQGVFLLGFDLWLAGQSSSRVLTVEAALRPHLTLTPSLLHDLGATLSFSF